MALERLDILQRDARLQSGNKAYTPTSGVRMSEVVRYFNEGQEGIQNKILQTKSSLFTRQTSITVTPGVATYPTPATIPNVVHTGGNIIGVSYSFDGNQQNFYPLDLRSPRQEVSVNAYPTSYFLRDGQIVLSPIPNQAGTLRVDYQYTLPALDIRRGLISAHDLSSITLTLNTTFLTETAEDLAAGLVDYISVVDKDGQIIANSIPVTGYNSSTRVISCTLTSAQNTAIQNNTNWVVFGSWTTTNSALPPICRRYLVHYAARLIQMRDSNSETTVTKDLLDELEAEILASTADLEEDITAVALLDTTYLNYDLG
jgi:hypothetical protein